MTEPVARSTLQSMSIPYEFAVARANDAARLAADRVHSGPVSDTFASFASLTARSSGRPSTIVVRCLVIVAWAVSRICS
jgi:hypothetical protein